MPQTAERPAPTAVGNGALVEQPQEAQDRSTAQTASSSTTRARTSANPIDVLIARLEARADILERGGDVDAIQEAQILRMAADELFFDPHSGLSPTFAEACERADAERARQQRKPAHRREPGVAASTLAAAEYLVQQNDPQRLEAWIMKRFARDRAAIVAHLNSTGKPR
jgi:hypothetical protein